jgi:hypothetical protein
MRISRQTPSYSNNGGDLRVPLVALSGRRGAPRLHCRRRAPTYEQSQRRATPGCGYTLSHASCLHAGRRVPPAPTTRARALRGRERRVTSSAGPPPAMARSAQATSLSRGRTTSMKCASATQARCSPGASTRPPGRPCAASTTMAIVLLRVRERVDSISPFRCRGIEVCRVGQFG